MARGLRADCRQTQRPSRGPESVPLPFYPCATDLTNRGITLLYSELTGEQVIEAGIKNEKSEDHRIIRQNNIGTSDSDELTSSTTPQESELTSGQWEVDQGSETAIQDATDETSTSQPQKAPRRRKIDPTTCAREYSDDEVEFMKALDRYKRENGRQFPTCCEILEVVRGLGYQRAG